MDRPPQASIRVENSCWHGAAVAVLASACVAVTGLFCFAQGVQARTVLAVLACMVVLWYSGISVRRSAGGILHWTGSCWKWSGFGEAPLSALQLVLDWQHLLLVQVRSAHGQREWLWLKRGQSPHAWHAMRRALHGSSCAQQEAL